MGKWLWITIAVVAVVAIIGGVLWWSNFGVSVSRYEVTSNKLPKGFEGYKIVQLSDLHSATMGKENTSLLNAIRQEKPDIIVMTGDMVSRYDADFDVSLNLATALAAEYPVYYIRGNHEMGLTAEDRDGYLSNLAECGVAVLDNQAVALEAENGNTVNLLGLWYNLDYYHQMASYYKPLTVDVIKTIIGDAPKGYNILLAHNPNHFDAYAQWGADLVFCGHIHGGMVRLPFIGGVLSPETLLFPKYDAGMYTIEESTMITSRGLGRGRMGIRIFNPPDVVSITLHNSDK